MRVVQLICWRPPALPGGLAEARFPDSASVQEVCIDRDGLLVARLAGALAAGPTPVPTARGLVGELTSRPGREVEAWLAVATGCSGRLPLGLISLVRSRRSDTAAARYSVGWLVVRPDARRRGVGRGLVAHACRRAWEQGADEVRAETRADWAAALGFWEAVGFAPACGPQAGAETGPADRLSSRVFEIPP